MHDTIVFCYALLSSNKKKLYLVLEMKMSSKLHYIPHKSMKTEKNLFTYSQNTISKLDKNRILKEKRGEK
jgi:hypothetical protein